MSDTKFYTPKEIMKTNSDYYVIYGERSNGKTTSILKLGLEMFCRSGYEKQLGVIRRWEEDIKGASGEAIMSNLVSLGWVAKETNGEYNQIVYRSRKWYLAKYSEDGEKEKECPKPFAYAFALTREEHYKMQSFPDIDMILFDEFLARNAYLPNEFVVFSNLLSTIIRLRDTVKIFMCGNTINKFCPYFAEMGLKNVKTQQRGTIDLYTYGDSKLKVAVEYSDFDGKKKRSNKYFAFDNPKLKMITGGEWELALYPHLPEKYIPKECLYKFYIVFDEERIQGNIISVGDNTFLYFHRKTTPLKEDNEQLVFSTEDNYKLNYRKNILRPYGKVDKLIYTLLVVREKSFYQDNEVGEIVNNYLKWCKSQSLIRN